MAYHHLMQRSFSPARYAQWQSLPMLASGAITGLCFQQKENEGLNLEWSEENRETKVVCVPKSVLASWQCRSTLTCVLALQCPQRLLALFFTSTKGFSVWVKERELQHLSLTKASLLYKLNETTTWFCSAKGRDNGGNIVMPGLL